VRASEIDFANIRELYNGLVTIEDEDFGGNPFNVTVTKLNKISVGLRFEYALYSDMDYEYKRLNSYFLDKGFKSFTLDIKEEDNQYVIETLFKTIKPQI
jgi:hypothetical protein